MGRLLLLVLLLGVTFAAPASAHEAHNALRTAPATRAADGDLAACPGAAISPVRVITGSFGTAEQGSNVLVPFDVPAGTTAVRVKYCFDQPESLLSAQFKHTLDLGIYQARKTPGELFDGEEFRGWGGSSHPDVTLSRQGPSTEAQYRAAPKEHVPGRTTRGFRPGPVPAGEWAAELGVAAVVGQENGDADGRVAWRIEVELSRDPAFASDPFTPARYDATPAKKGAGWYAGDLHVHAEHSALGDATMTEVFDYAFRKPEDGGAGLDFLTLSDYVAGTSWDEIGRYQPRHPGKLVVRSAEVITYRGHLSAHGTTNFTDYRTGRLLERRADGTLAERRAPLEPRELFRRIQADGGFTQVNHPTIFPSEVPGFAGQCRGCPWDYTDAQTDWDRVDAYEVHTGPAGFKLADGLGEPGPNPFTLTAVDEYDRLRRAGHRIAAVGVSDSHNAGRTNNAVTQSPIGVGTTVVRADELSENGIRRGVQAGHTYVKLFGPASPDLRLDAAASDVRATMGDLLVAPRARFTVKVTGGVATPQPRTLVVLRDGRPVEAVPVSGAEFTHTFTGEAEGDYRVQVLRGTAIDALTTPITLTRTAAPAGSASASKPVKARLRVRVRPRAVASGRRTTFRVFVFTGKVARPVPRAGVTVRFAGTRARTDRRGRAVLVRRVAKRGLRPVRVSRRGMLGGRAHVRVR